LTEAVRIVASVAREVQVSAGGLYDLGYHVVWCAKFRHPVRSGRSAAPCKGLIRAKPGEHGWRIVALEIMPDHVHLFVKAHRSDCPSRVASQFTGFTSRWLRAEFPHLRSRLRSTWRWPYFAAGVGTVSAQAVCWYTGPQHGRRWRKERAQ